MAKTIEEQTLEKLDKILRILVGAVSRGLKQREQIALLDAAGFSPKAIAELIGTSSGTVRVELVGLRKTRKASKGSS
jgi:DNA-directed RNA polymerase specialized sigma24 family protein